MEYQYSPEDIAKALGRPMPTSEQSAIIASPLEPRLVVAGAGSGKTATMVDRVVFLVANNLVRADQVLGVTFTRKAAGELRERMRMRLEELRRLGMVVSDSKESEPVADPVVSTYHSYANMLVSSYGLRLGIEQDAQMLGDAQSWQLVAQLVEHVDPKILPPEPQSKQTMISSVLKLAGECAEHLVKPQAVIDWCEQQVGRLEALPLAGRNRGAERNTLVSRLHNRIFYARLVQMYARVKKTMQVMDYGDLIALAAQISREIPQARLTERERFRVVLLDEFQDTSHAQMQLFSDLFGARDGRAEHPVMAVGDPKQSIYGFRGASDGQLFSFYDYFPTRDREPSYLTVAWRNDTAILGAANRVANPLKGQADWVRSHSRVQVPDLIARENPGSGRVRLGRYLTDSQEALAIAEQVATERESYMNQSQKSMPTMAVLCKKRAQMQGIARAFDEYSVPYQIVGLGGLLDTPEVIELVSTLRVLSDPGRSDALMRLMSGARWRLGISDLLALSDWAVHLERRRSESIRRGICEDLYAELTEQERQEELERLQRQTALDTVDGASLIEAIEQLPEPGWTSVHGRSLTKVGLARLEALATELAELRQYMADDLSTLLLAIEQKTMLDIELAAKPGVDPDTARRNIDAFHEVVATYARSAPRISATLVAGADLLGEVADDNDVVQLSLHATGGSASGVSGFLAWLDTAADQEAGLDMAVEEPRHDLVQILTVHASKGLEWDHVYIPGLVQGDFPINDDPRWTQNSETLPWPLRGDRNFLPEWRSDWADVVELKDDLSRLKEEAAEHRLAEERRLAYVGLTRARYRLVLTSSVWQGTKVKPAEASVFYDELVEASVGEVCAEVSADQVGKENPQSASIMTALWPFDPIDGPQIFEWKSQDALDAAHDSGDFLDESCAKKKAEQIRDLPATSRRVRLERAAENVIRGGLAHNPATTDSNYGGTVGSSRVLPNVEDWYQEADLLLSLLNTPVQANRFELPAHLTASDLVGLATDTNAVVENLIRPMPQKPGIAARQGSIFHSWVESRFDRAAMLDFGEEEYADMEVEGALDMPRLQKNFMESRWAQLQPWAVEYPIETPLGKVSLRGRVDAIFCHRNDEGTVVWELVDWKTGRSPRTTAEKKAKAVQLAAYRLGFSRLQRVPLEQVMGTFFYVGENKSWSPDQFADEAELLRLLNRAERAGQRR